MTTHEIEEGARRFMSDWRFWVGIAYFGLVAVIVALGVIYIQQRDANANRVAAEKAAQNAAVLACYQLRRDGPDTVKLLGLLVVLADNSIRSTEDIIAAGNLSPEERRIRLAALARLRPAKRSAEKFIKRMREQIPTKKECDAKARAIGLDPAKASATVNQP